MPQTPEVIRAINAQRGALLAHEAATMRDMATRWMQVENSLRADMLELSLYLDELRAQGQTITTARLMQMDRYRALIADARREHEQYSRWLADRLAQEQRALLAQGIAEAQQLIEAAGMDAGLVGMIFDRINVGAVDYMIGFAFDGSPLYDLLRASYPESVVSLTSALIEGLAKGLGPRATAAQMAANMGGNLARALLIARTEQLRALRAGNMAQMNGSNVVSGYLRRSQRNATVCPACLALDNGQVYPTDEAYAAHPNCLVPGTLVSGRVPDYVMSRDYKGDVFTISTSSGNFLTTTPNHPILTDRGWVAANLLVKGDNVVTSVIREGTKATVNPDDYQVPTLIEDVAGSLGMNVLGSVPVSAEDFHGDGVNSNVGVIWANGLLGNNRCVVCGNEISKLDLGGGNVRRSILSGSSNLATMLKGLFLTAHSSVRRGIHGLTLFGRHLGETDKLGRGYSPDGNSGLLQGSANDRPGNVIRNRQFLLRHAALIFGNNFKGVLHGDFTGRLSLEAEQSASLEFIREMLFVETANSGGALLDSRPIDIQFDRVVNVSISAFDGHVYNLQNKDGWYIANNIITHNCQCFMQPVLRFGKTPKFQTGPEWLATQPEDVQRQILGAGRYQRYQDGELDWGNVATVYDDPTWGATIRTKNLADL